MSIEKPMADTTIHDYDSLAYVATDPMPRDRDQSGRLHEPGLMISSIDPVSGRDIGDVEAHPFIVDGSLVIYFESETTKQAYIDTPTDHPVPLPDNPDEDWVAEG